MNDKDNISDYANVLVITGFIVIFVFIFIGFIIGFLFLKPQPTLFNAEKEIKISRDREDLLLQQFKLIDYQISVLTEKVMQ